MALLPVFIVVAFAPGVFWLWFYIRGRRYRPGPRRLLVLSFFFGMLSTIPAGLIEWLVLSDSLEDINVSIPVIAAAMLFVVGPVEETAKFLAVRFGAYRSRYFEEPLDGLTYGTAASLGFASLENLLYVMIYGPAVIIVRAPLSTLGHAVFASMWAHPLGLTAGAKKGGNYRVLWGLGSAALFHGLFNISVFTIPAFAVLLVLIGGVWLWKLFAREQEASPYKLRRNYPLVECAAAALR